MCGIIGVTGEADAVPLLLGALHQLEYRGYDSAGIAMVVDEEGGAAGAGPGAAIWRVRAAGGTNSVAKLAELAADAPRGHHAAIGHTRWATHGSPTAENAHPHTDCTGRLAIIHNGIIENHAELRAELEAAGHTLTSATDTEVMAHLIEQEMAAGASLPEATRSMLRRVRGAFSIAAVSADEPDTIVAARRSTPLVLGLHDGMALLASDIPALIGHTRRVFALADDELAVLTPGFAGGLHARRGRRSSPSSSPSPGTSRRRRRAATRTSCPRRSTSSRSRWPTRCSTAAGPAVS